MGISHIIIALQLLLLSSSIDALSPRSHSWSLQPTETHKFKTRDNGNNLRFKAVKASMAVSTNEQDADYIGPVSESNSVDDWQAPIEEIQHLSSGISPSSADIRPSSDDRSQISDEYTDVAEYVDSDYVDYTGYVDPNAHDDWEAPVEEMDALRQADPLPEEPVAEDAGYVGDANDPEPEYEENSGQEYADQQNEQQELTEEELPEEKLPEEELPEEELPVQEEELPVQEEEAPMEEDQEQSKSRDRMYDDEEHWSDDGEEEEDSGESGDWGDENIFDYSRHPSRDEIYDADMSKNPFSLPYYSNSNSGSYGRFDEDFREAVDRARRGFDSADSSQMDRLRRMIEQYGKFDSGEARRFDAMSSARDSMAYQIDSQRWSDLISGAVAANSRQVGDVRNRALEAIRSAMNPGALPTRAHETIRREVTRNRAPLAKSSAPTTLKSEHTRNRMPTSANSRHFQQAANNVIANTKKPINTVKASKNFFNAVDDVIANTKAQPSGSPHFNRATAASVDVTEKTSGLAPSPNFKWAVAKGIDATEVDARADVDTRRVFGVMRQAVAWRQDSQDESRNQIFDP